MRATSIPSLARLPKRVCRGRNTLPGTHISPQITWWNESAPFMDYINRTQSVVQNGKFVADVLYYYGDHIPNVFPYKYSDPAGAMPGFDCDVAGEDILLKLKVKDGKLIVPGGVEPDYRPVEEITGSWTVNFDPA